MADRYPRVAAVQEALFHLPQRLTSLAEEELPEEARDANITPTDLRLMAAAWDREYLALWGSSKQAPQVGFHLVGQLLALKAHKRAAERAARLASRYPGDPLLDSFLYLEGLARAESRQDGPALKLFEAVAEREFPTAEGTLQPSTLRGDARYATARLYEARGDLDRARRAYRLVGESHGEALPALAALQDVRLEPDARVQAPPGEALRLPLRAANLDLVHVRAYRLDLRTVFLRDGGLQRVRDLRVSGVSPAWSGERRVTVGPFPREVEIELPLKEPGAYLVQLDGGGQEATALALRTRLRLSADEAGGALRVRVRSAGGRAAAGVQLRALQAAGSPVQAKTTDLRGVALLPPGASVLAFDGEHYAFHQPDPSRPQRPAPPSFDDEDLEGWSAMDRGVNARLQQQVMGNKAAYEARFSKRQAARLDISAF